MSFLEAKVSFRSNFLSILSAIKHNSSLLSKLKHYIHWSKAALLKRIFFEIFECLGQICQIPHVSFEVNSFSNFKSFVIVVTHNSPVSFKPTYFLLWIKKSHQSPNFETFECSSENLPNSSCYFSNQKSFFLQVCIFL